MWVHVDRFDKRNGRVWSVQHWQGNRCVEWTARDVKILITPASGVVIENGKQPRAVIEIEGAQVRAVGSGSIVISRAEE